jgi:hypothetical protein
VATRHLYYIHKEIWAASVTDAMVQEPEMPVLDCYRAPEEETHDHDTAKAIGFAAPSDDEDDE